MSWLILFVAGLLEIVWAVGLKLSENFTKPLASTVTSLALVASLVLLSIAMRTLPLGTAYAVWTGIGAVGTVIVGIVWFHDPFTFTRVICIAMIVGGILGLKLTS
ncbi:MAG TPA: multidrug efflux SMR transporter [Solimonas sp.]